MNNLFAAVRATTSGGSLDDGSLLDGLPVGVYVCDADGLIVRYNRAASELWGRAPCIGEPDERFCGSYRLRDLDGAHIPHVECPMAVAIATGKGCRDQFIQVERPDGSRIVAEVSIEVLTDAVGSVTGAVNVLRDSARRKDQQTSHERSAREQVFQALPAAIYTTDVDGRITFFNEAAARLWGVRPTIGESAFCGSWKLYWPDGTPLPHDECPMAMALKQGRAIDGMEAVAERPDGTRIPFLAYPTPLFDDAGAPSGAVNMLVDISGRKSGEMAMQRLAAIVESSDDAIVATDLDGIVTSWNRGAERLLGYADHEVIGQPVTMLIPADRQDEEPEILARIRRGERIDHYETLRRRKDGALVDISLSVSPIVAPDGQIVGASKIARDITERRRAEAQKDLLLGEMNHRVKNLFALSSGLVHLSGRSATSVDDLAADLQDRFAALARAHSLTMPGAPETRETKQGANACASQPPVMLHGLIRQVTLPYLEDRNGEVNARVTIAGPDIAVGQSAISSFALILHEFATNAVKYGALANQEGRVLIECLDAEPDFRLVWREIGGPKIETEPTREGFGSKLARATIGGTLGGAFSRAFTPEGLEITLTVPRARLHG